MNSFSSLSSRIACVQKAFLLLVVVYIHIYTEQKKNRKNKRPTRIFEFKGKMLIISGLLLYDFPFMGY